MVWAAAIPAIAGLAGGLLGSKSPKAAQYHPWSTDMAGLGAANFANGRLSINPDAQQQLFQQQLYGMGQDALGRYSAGLAGGLGPEFLRGEFGNANLGSSNALGNLTNAYNMATGGGLPGIMSGLPSLSGLGMANYNQGLPSSFFGNGQGFQSDAQAAQGLSAQSLQAAQNGYGGQNFLNAGQGLLGGYQNQNFNNLRGNLQTNFDPNAASSNYTNLLRQQAQPQEQQAASSALSQLFNSGRLGTTGGMQAYQTLMDSQNQADIGRQVAGQQFGLQQQLQSQQGLDAALTAEQNRQLGGFGANQMGMMNQYNAAQGLASTGAGLFGGAFNNAGMAQQLAQGADAFGFNRLMGLNDTAYNRMAGMDQINADRQMYNNQQQMGLNQAGFDRSFAMNQNAYNQNLGNFGMANQLYTNSDTATQDRFNRALQLFGGENAMNQQGLQDFMSFLGAGQSQNQQLLDLARIGASVGTAQNSQNANAALIGNQNRTDLFAGFLGALGQGLGSYYGK
jgi:hypothetical protein